MAGIYGLSREAVRVKVKKCEGSLPCEWRKFSVDPQITSLEVLYSILAKAFDLKSDFSISYKTVDPNGQEVYLGVLSDWDLDAAFLRAHNHSISHGTDPCLSLTVDIKPFSETSDWDTTNTTTKEVTPLQQSIGVGQKYVQNVQSRLPGLIMNHMEKTFSMVTRALNFVEDQSILQPLRQPLSDAEFRSFLDSVGQIVQAKNLRKVIYNGGIDPSLRRVVWKHILNVYPEGMTGRQRMDYMKQKAAEYYRLRDVWRVAIQQGPVAGELAYVTSMVRKDVLRTDRLHPFYAGNDDNQNIASLFNILTTYALNHPAVSYCQGMSDIASPLLVTMCDEAQAYICFCAIMKRLSTNFMLDGIAMTQKFTHLSEALQFYDPEFFDYLKLQQADDLLFCYRWLLLEMKREFAFDDSLRMLEVLWSSLPSQPPIGELNLFEKEFVPPTKDAQSSPKSTSSDVIMRKPRETAYTKLCALRRQSSSQSLLLTSPNTINSSDSTSFGRSLDGTKRFNQSLDENITRTPVGNSRNISKSYQSLDESKLRQMTQHHNQKATIQLTEINDKSQVNNFEVKNNEKNQQQSDASLNNNDEVGEEHLVTKSQTTHIKPDEQSTTTNNNHIMPTSEDSNSTASSHFKGLKDRIAASKKEIFASFDKIEKYPFEDLVKSNSVESENQSGETTPKGGKIVKNFNEFLNFASKGAKLTLIRSASVSSSESRSSKRASLRMTRSSHQNLNSEKILDTDKMDDSSPKENEPNVMNRINKKKLQLQLEEKKQSSFDGSSPDDSEYFPMTTSITRECYLELDNLNRQVFGNNFSQSKVNTNGFDMADSKDSLDSHISNNRSSANFSTKISYKKFNESSEDDVQLDQIYSISSDKNPTEEIGRSGAGGFNAEVFVWENPLHVSPTVQEPSTSKSHSNVDTKNPFYEKDFLQTLTPDEQIELEYDGELIDEVTGKKSITPIRLVRKKDDDRCSSKRNSKVLRNDSETDSENSEKVLNDLMKTSMLSETNPFLMDITASAASIDNTTPTNNQDVFIDEEASEAETEPNIVLLDKVTTTTTLPPPNEFGGGNPFLMFLCLSLLLQHRNFVMKNNMDYNEMAMHFDKMVRKHNVVRVLNQSRRMYADYLKSQNIQRKYSATNASASGTANKTNTNRVGTKQ
ncbi:uncharacterized protein LOC116336911 [Contarinia nasturtii]|uniref:uncharacterized protein LOC116336911 n=1 Tax=Contarinia nasturtii TaxID=265458 RepID=UPI0012D3851C|nr:uncharacterized protein LOC116336911 [Contarinia nasturtii]